MSIIIYNPNLTEIHDTVKIGDGTRIGVFTSIRGSAIIGVNCVIGSHCNICPDVIIDDNVSIQTGCHITRGVRIGKMSFLGPGVITTNDKYMEYHLSPKLVAPIIGEYVRIGAGVILLPGITIGNDVIIGAGSVVTKSINNNETWFGNPARKKK